MVQIKWLIEAKIDLREIYEYIASDSKRYAKLQVERIKNRTQILKPQPLLGKSVEEIENDEVFEIVEGNYRIIYKSINSKCIHILMIHHGARDLTRRIKK